uniref:C-type lectin domain-containing protein n=1 Tax=Astyanax mexicanus TaxID=7994 RepID=A0A3B1K3T0_ASTMX
MHRCLKDISFVLSLGQKFQQLMYFQVKGEKWLLKLKLLILAVLCVLLGAFLVAYKVQGQSLTLTNVDEVCCAVGWKYFSGKCYFFSDDTNTWTASRDECLAAGGDLVIISSIEELDFLKRSKPGPGPDHYWVGLSDAVKEGDWRWLDGTKLNNTPRYWKGIEPDNWKGKNNEYTEGEDCSNMEISSSRFSLWDGLCDVQIAIHKRVCEAKVSK